MEGRPKARYDTTQRVESTPERSCGAARGRTVRMAPWNPAPNPTPPTAVPMKNTTPEVRATAARVMPTPAISPTVPRNMTVRGGVARSTSTVKALNPARTNRAAPPSIGELEPTTCRTRSGPSEA
jgi:hypothetical protein